MDPGQAEEDDGDDALGDEGAQAVLNALGISVIGEAVRHLVRERLVPIHPVQQRGAGIRSDGTAVESNHHTAASVGFKLQGFGVTLCRQRSCRPSKACCAAPPATPTRSAPAIPDGLAMHDRDDWYDDPHAAEERERLTTPLHREEAEREAHRLEEEREQYLTLEAHYQAAMEQAAKHWNADDWDAYFAHAPRLPEVAATHFFTVHASSVSDRVRIVPSPAASPAGRPAHPQAAKPASKPFLPLAWLLILALVLFVPLTPLALWIAATFTVPLVLSILASYAALPVALLTLWGILRGIDQLRGRPGPKP